MTILSIMGPVYNVEIYSASCILSVLSQCLKNIKLIQVNDKFINPNMFYLWCGRFVV